jgi:hypothetical protein
MTKKAGAVPDMAAAQGMQGGPTGPGSQLGQQLMQQRAPSSPWGQQTGAPNMQSKSDMLQASAGGGAPGGFDAAAMQARNALQQRASFGGGPPPGGASFGGGAPQRPGSYGAQPSWGGDQGMKMPAPGQLNYSQQAQQGANAGIAQAGMNAQASMGQRQPGMWGSGSTPGGFTQMGAQGGMGNGNLNALLSQGKSPMNVPNMGTQQVNPGALAGAMRGTSQLASAAMPR